MTQEPNHEHELPSNEVEGEAPVTDPAHRAALLAMVVAPVVIGAVVYAILKFIAG